MEEEIQGQELGYFSLQKYMIKHRHKAAPVGDGGGAMGGNMGAWGMEPRAG